MVLVRLRLCATGEAADNEVDDRVGKDGYDDTNDRVKNRILRTSYRAAVTTRYGIANTTDDQHDHADGTDNEEEYVRNRLKYIVITRITF